jgi:hypothetical protein
MRSIAFRQDATGRAAQWTSRVNDSGGSHKLDRDPWRAAKSSAVADRDGCRPGFRCNLAAPRGFVRLHLVLSDPSQDFLAPVEGNLLMWYPRTPHVF